MPTLSETLWNYLQPRPGSATDELRNQLASLLTGWSSKTSTPGTPKHNANVWLEEAARNLDSAIGGPERNRLRAVGPHDPTLDAQDRESLNQKMLNFVLNLGPQATVWHGSPHDILPKPGGKYPEFDMSKIGTGEGAQAYGHGLYMAENPSIARYYQNTVPDPALKKHIAMQDRYWDLPIPDKLSEAAMDKFSEMVRQLGKTPSVFVKNQLKKGYITKDVADELMAIGLDGAKPVYQSYLYKVDIPDEAIPRMLDWDKPLSQQSPEVQGLLGELATANQAHINGTPLRQFIYDNAKQSGSLPSVVIREIEKAGSLDAAIPALDQKFANANEAAKGKYGELMTLLRQHNISMDVMPDSVRTGGDIVRSGYNPPEIAEMLKARGIPGIRYLDGGSRSAGQGTSNYVLFDDKLPRILEKNGVPTGQTPWTPEEWAAYLSGGGK